MVAENLQRPEELPQYWLDAAQFLDSPRPDHRRLGHAGARDAGHRLRVVPVGQHRRPDHARADRPALRRPRAHPLRHAAVGRPRERLRRPAPGGHARPRRHRAAWPASWAWATSRSATTCSTSATTSPGPARRGRCSARRPASDRWRASAAPPRTCPTRRSRCRTSSSWPPRPTCPTRRRSRCSRSSDPVGIFRADPRRPRPCCWPATATAWSTSASAGLVDGTEAVLYSASFAGDGDEPGP